MSQENTCKTLESLRGIAGQDSQHPALAIASAIAKTKANCADCTGCIWQTIEICPNLTQCPQLTAFSANATPHSLALYIFNYRCCIEGVQRISTLETNEIINILEEN